MIFFGMLKNDTNKYNIFIIKNEKKIEMITFVLQVSFTLGFLELLNDVVL